MSTGIGLARADGVAVVTLDRPERRNAVDRAMVLEFISAVDDAEADPPSTPPRRSSPPPGGSPGHVHAERHDPFAVSPVIPAPEQKSQTRGLSSSCRGVIQMHSNTDRRRGSEPADTATPPIRGDAPVDELAMRNHREPQERAGPRDAVAELAHDYWQFRVREFPVEASLAGVRHADSKVEGAALADVARRVQLCEAMSLRAREIDVTRLDVESATTWTLLTEQLTAITEAHACEEHYRPRLFPLGFENLPVFWLRQASLNSITERDAFMSRLSAIPQYLRDSVDLLRQGFLKGYRVPRSVVPPTLRLMDADLAEDDGVAAFVRAKFSQPLPGADPKVIETQRDRVSTLLSEVLVPALREVRDVIAGLSSTETTDDDGLHAQPGGREYYRYKVRDQTSTDLEPDTIHQTGLDEISRIRSAIDLVVDRMGRPGETKEVAAELDRTIAADSQSLLASARAFAKRVDGLIPSAFSRLPRITYGVELFSPALSASMPPAMAQSAPADRSGPGIFWLTALPERLPLHLIPALTLHEAWPGHLMQFSIAHELDDLPDFRRFTWQSYSSYVEGWGMYCEQLGHELGAYDSLAEEFGMLSFELWRAARLVVDTGIHWKGWNREQAVAYLQENSFLHASTCESEVDRYIGMPAQALGYKLGELAISGLRVEVAEKLGEGFSLPAFHNAVLGLGPLSLTELRARIRAWADDRHRTGAP